MTADGRALRSWVLEPRRERTQARERLAAIGLLRGGLWQTLRSELKGSSDVERITARTALRQVRPRELVGLAATLARSQQLSRALAAGIGAAPPALLQRIAADLTPHAGCAELLTQAIAPEPAALVRDVDVRQPGLELSRAGLREVVAAQRELLQVRELRLAPASSADTCPSSSALPDRSSRSSFGSNANEACDVSGRLTLAGSAKCHITAADFGSGGAKCRIAAADFDPRRL